MKTAAISQVPEFKLAEGVYFTDFRQNLGSQSNNCLNSALNQQ